MSVLTDAMHFAVDAHGDAPRKGDGAPAILHSMEAAAIAATLTGDEEVLAAAVLHDTVEDAGILPEEIRARFGERVANLVCAETEDKRRHLPPSETWRARKEETLSHLRRASDSGIAIVFLSDKLSNMRSLYRMRLQKGDALWEEFHQKDPAQHHWYYRTIADLLKPLADTPAWREFDQLIRQVFEETRQDTQS